MPLYCSIRLILRTWSAHTHEAGFIEWTNHSWTKPVMSNRTAMEGLPPLMWLSPIHSQLPSTKFTPRFGGSVETQWARERRESRRLPLLLLVLLLDIVFLEKQVILILYFEILALFSFCTMHFLLSRSVTIFCIQRVLLLLKHCHILG